MRRIHLHIECLFFYIILPFYHLLPCHPHVRPFSLCSAAVRQPPAVAAEQNSEPLKQLWCSWMAKEGGFSIMAVSLQEAQLQPFVFLRCGNQKIEPNLSVSSCGITQLETLAATSVISGSLMWQDWGETLTQWAIRWGVLYIGTVIAWSRLWPKACDECCRMWF